MVYMYLWQFLQFSNVFSYEKYIIVIMYSLIVDESGPCGFCRLMVESSVPELSWCYSKVILDGYQWRLIYLNLLPNMSTTSLNWSMIFSKQIYVSTHKLWNHRSIRALLLSYNQIEWCLLHKLDANLKLPTLCDYLC